MEHVTQHERRPDAAQSDRDVHPDFAAEAEAYKQRAAAYGS